jgi:hypothetical protein
MEVDLDPALFVDDDGRAVSGADRPEDDAALGRLERVVAHGPVLLQVGM